MSYGDNPETLDYIDHLEAENERLREANKHLKDQLRWRPVSEKPENDGKYLVKVLVTDKLFPSHKKDTTIRLSGFDVSCDCGWAAEHRQDKRFEYEVVSWLPIPPAPEGE